MQGYLYIGSRQALPTSVVSGGSTPAVVQAINKTGAAVAKDDKVWINENGVNYDIINYYSDIRNFDVNGSPTINDETKVVSGFSTSSYLKLQNAFNPRNNPWEFRCKFITGNSLTGDQCLFKSGISSPSHAGRFGCGCSFYNANFQIGISTNGTSWDIAADATGTYTILANTEYWLKYWTGCTPNSTETLQGCTYNFTDTGVATTLNVFVVNKTENIVLTPNNSYPNGWKLGTVNIPAHTVYEYDNGYWTEAE